MAQASTEYKRPCQISFKGALQTLKALESILLTAKDAVEIYRRLVRAIATHGDRPGRVEPRAKKRGKNYALLTKPRQQARKRWIITT